MTNTPLLERLSWIAGIVGTLIALISATTVFMPKTDKPVSSAPVHLPPRQGTESRDSSTGKPTQPNAGDKHPAPNPVVIRNNRPCGQQQVQSANALIKISHNSLLAGAQWYCDGVTISRDPKVSSSNFSYLRIPPGHHEVKAQLSESACTLGIDVPNKSSETAEFNLTCP